MSPRQYAVWSVLSGLGIVAMTGLPDIAPRAIAAPPPQLTADDAALIKLNVGRRAFNDKNYPVAVASFKEFLASHAGLRQAPSAWYGLGLCILQTPHPDFPAAVDDFEHAAMAADFSDRPLALYYLASSLRGLGNTALNETATQRYTDAAAQFTLAQAAFEKRITEKVPAAPTPLPLDVEWSARCRCDLAEMLLRLGKYKEALATSTPFQSDAVLGRSRYRQLGLYHLGYAQFVLGDYLSAGKSLSQLAPFAQDFGLHARYLLARVHHLSDERPEASAQYKAVQDDFNARRVTAAKLLQDPALDPQRRGDCEALAAGPVPDYVRHAQFYAAVLQYENAHFGQAADEFTKIIAIDPAGPLVTEAKLRLGYCNLQQKKFTEAIALLDPLKEDKQFGDRALWWLARAKVAAADPHNPQQYQDAIIHAINLLRASAARDAELSPVDPDAKARHGDVLLDLADMQLSGKLFKDAADTYQLVIADDPRSDRAEQAMQRKVTSLHLGGLFKESDAAGDLFVLTYPKSTLLPAVLFRQAENAYLTALATNDGKDAHPHDEQQKLFAIAAGRYQKLIARYSDFDYTNLARQALATCDARMEHYADAIKVLQAIPEADRTGELVTVPYLLADCEIRTLPEEADDALTAERLIETAEDAAKYLETFLVTQPKSPQIPDAMLKLGYCYERMASQVAVADERQKLFVKARTVYNNSTAQFPADPSQPTITFERGKVLAELGDVNGAQAEFSKFLNDPLHHTSNAPLAMVRLSALLRSAGQAQQAVELMKRCRDEFEPVLATDPATAPWIPMIRYEQALALKDSKQLTEARILLENLVKQFSGKPAAIDAQWRIAQCRRLEVSQKLTEVRQVAEKPGADPNEVAAAYHLTEEPLKGLSQATELLRTQAEAQAGSAANSESTLRMLYELAWCYRVQGDVETNAARMKMQNDAVEKVKSHWPKDQSGAPALLRSPEIALADVPFQASEQKAHDAYQRLIVVGPASALACQARFELAELLSQRGEIDPALDLLGTALQNLPPRELQQRIKVRVAAALIAKNNPQFALAQLKPIMAEKDSPVAAEARYLTGEAQILQQDWPAAIATLHPFFDQEPYRSNAAIADRALLRLGYAYDQTKDWNSGGQCYSAVIDRFPQSPMIDEARFGVAMALQSQLRYDEAVNLYNDLTHRTADESAARALLNIGICRLEQKRPDEALKALQAVPLTYDYPDCTAAAWYQAARAQVEMKQPKEAARLWTRVVTDYPATSWASLSQKRLAEIK